MSSPSHPIWTLLKLGMVMCWVTLVLWLTASSFDETEAQSILTIAAGLLGLEGWKYASQKEDKSS